MDKDSQFNMIVYVREDNYLEGSGGCHNKITQPIPSTKRKRKPRRTETTLQVNSSRQRIVDYMSFIRPFFGRPEHGCQAPGTVKIQTGQLIDVL